MKRLILLFLATPGFADDADQAAFGRLLYADNCLACHTKDGSGEGGDGVDIRGIGHAPLARALKGFDGMPEFGFADDEIDALATWLGVLDEGD